jgi:ABC-2 type transport system ATP-binding protein
MLSGLIKPTSGHFTIDGLSPQKNGFKLRQIIGIVPQEYALYPTLTARENLMFFGSLYGLSHKNLKNSIMNLWKSWVYQNLQIKSGTVFRRNEAPL